MSDEPTLDINSAQPSSPREIHAAASCAASALASQLDKLNEFVDSNFPKEHQIRRMLQNQNYHTERSLQLLMNDIGSSVSLVESAQKGEMSNE